ncbi:MAG: hypothetical protein ACE5GL_02235 [Calditrichia bacterium]
MSNSSNPSPEIIKHVYSLCYNFSATLVGKEKTRELLLKSYRKILPYFQSLSSFEMDKKNGLMIQKPDISEKEFLSFTVWIQQFIKDFKAFMVGLHHLSIETITAEIKDQLEETGFYEYYREATELEY